MPVYLAIRADGSPLHVRENLSVADLLAVQAGVLAVYRFHPKKARYQRLVLDDRWGEKHL